MQAFGAQLGVVPPDDNAASIHRGSFQGCWCFGFVAASCHVESVVQEIIDGRSRNQSELDAHGRTRDTDSSFLEMVRSSSHFTSEVSEKAAHCLHIGEERLYVQEANNHRQQVVAETA